MTTTTTILDDSERRVTIDPGCNVTIHLKGADKTVSGRAYPIASEVDPRSRMYGHLRSQGLAPADYCIVTGPGWCVPNAVGEAIVEAVKRQIEARKQRVDDRVPSLSKLREAIESNVAAHEQERRWIAGDGLGRRPGRGVTDGELAELRKRYPAAALYLRAEHQSRAANPDKSAAGTKAMALVREGKTGEARLAMDGWLDRVYAD